MFVQDDKRNPRLESQPQIILAFPGMGKTPLSKSRPGYVDADFGEYRKIMRISKEQEDKLLLPFAQFIWSLSHAKVLTNEPKLMRFVKVAHVYLPKDPSYSARKMGVSNDQILKWTRDWETLAKRYHVPVTWIDGGLDHYLR